MADEKIIVGQGGSYPLNGILSLPEGAGGPFPAAVLVHGSGSSNMDEKIYANAPFRDLAEGLSARGVATIRYDKRTFVYGKKAVKDHGFTVFDETIEDAVLASALLKADPRIDADRVFVIGHSMGGSLAPRIDAEGGDFAGLILMAGTPRKLEEVLFEQIDEQVRTYRWPLSAIAKKQGASIRKKLAGFYDMSDEEAKAKKIMGGTRAYYWKDFGEKDVASYLEKTSKPILVMQGGKDVQVSVERDFNVYKELLAGRDNAAFKLYPELNHLFMPSVYGEIKKVFKEYKIPSHVAEEVLDDLAAWIAAI